MSPNPFTANSFPTPHPIQHPLPRFPLVLLWLGFALVGWHLTAQGIVLFLGISIGVAAMSFAWRSSPWLGGLFGYLPQVLLIALLISALVTVVAIVPLAITLIILPVLTTYYAWQELHLLDLEKPLLWKILLTIILLGLGIGELTDLLIFPSPK